MPRVLIPETADPYLQTGVRPVVGGRSGRELFETLPKALQLAEAVDKSVLTKAALALISRVGEGGGQTEEAPQVEPPKVDTREPYRVPTEFGKKPLGEPFFPKAYEPPDVRDRSGWVPLSGTGRAPTPVPSGEPFFRRAYEPPAASPPPSPDALRRAALDLKAKGITPPVAGPPVAGPPVAGPPVAGPAMGDLDAYLTPDLRYEKKKLDEEALRLKIDWAKERSDMDAYTKERPDVKDFLERWHAFVGTYSDSPYRQAREKFFASVPGATPPEVPAAGRPTTAPTPAPSRPEYLAPGPVQTPPLAEPVPVGPFKPVPYSEIRARMLEAQIAGDKDEIIRLARIYRQSGGYGVRPESLSDLLTGAHRKRADLEILEIAKGGSKDTTLDNLIKRQRLLELETKNKYANAFNQSRNKKAFAEGLIAEAKAGNAEALEEYKLNRAMYDAAIKGEEARAAPEHYAIKTEKEGYERDKAQIDAAHAEKKAQLDERLKQGGIDKNTYEIIIKKIDAQYHEALVKSQIARNYKPPISISVVSKHELKTGEGTDAFYLKRQGRYEDDAVMAKNDIANGKAALDEMDKILVDKDGKPVDPNWQNLLAKIPNFEMALRRDISIADAKRALRSKIAGAETRLANAEKAIKEVRMQAAKSQEGTLEAKKQRWVAAGAAFPSDKDPVDPVSVGADGYETKAAPGKDGKLLFSFKRKVKDGKPTGPWEVEGEPEPL